MKTKYALGLAMSLAALLPLHGDETPTPSAPAIVRDSSCYIDLGLGPFPLPLPVFGLGHREQWQHHGMDVHLQVSTIVEVTSVKGSALYLHYFKPNLPSQFYMGAGAGIGGLFNKHRDFRLYGSPEFVLGKQYLNEAGDKRYFQTQMSFPTFSEHAPVYFPLIVFSYGIMF